MTPCTRPCCDGEIADDGYCDACGRAAEPVATAAGPGSPGPGSSGTSSSGRHAVGGSDPGPPTASQGAMGPPTTASTPSGRAATPSGRTASGRTLSGRTGSHRTSSRRHIGGGLVEIAATPRRDPADAVLTDPRVPENSRFCGACEAPVGRSRDGRPGRTEGFCPRCGTRFSFSPALTPGDLVAGQYEVLGALAHGGLGWIYLASDQAVDGRWVVLKGLLNTGDEAALAAAIAERGFLAQLVHPRIVRIYNMVAAGDDSAGYIVMEYIDGTSLRQMRDPRRPMPPEQALAYVLEVLPALAHMHEQGLLYCDFKPDNVVQTGTDVTLIDLGAVRRMDDPGGDVWGTVGYQAPEIRPGGAGPSIASDVYTVGRALAVLTMNFDFSRTMTDRLPDAVDAPVLAEHDPLRRLLARATDPSPARRFGSVEELSEQITGVLRLIVAAASPTPPPPRLSPVFGAPRATVGAGIAGPPSLAALPAALPVPLADPEDPAAPALAGAGGPRERLAALAELARAGLDSDEARRHGVLARVETREPAAVAEAAALLAEAAVPDDPLWSWAAATVAAATGDVAGLRHAAEDVLDALPGELAAWFLAAVAAEHAGEPAAAARQHERVWRADHGWIGAAFGLARTRLAAGDRAGAVAVLDEVPSTSVHHVDARVAAVRVRAGDAAAPGPEGHAALLDAGRRCASVELDAVRRAELECEVLEAGLRRTDESDGSDGASDEDLLGCPLEPRGLAFGLESRYRLRARFAPTVADRIALVDRANDVRPWTRV